jgi:predicted RNase H-like nuclease (RuvC/YqgF family)
MSSDDQATTEDRASELDSLRRVPQYVRELRFKVRQLSKTCGKQGQTIHSLRAELAEVRELNSKIDRGDLRRLERVAKEQAETIAALEQKLAAEPAADTAGA